MLAGLTALLGGGGGGGGSFESIATATGTGSNTSITFSSIPSTYKHLQVRIMSRNTAAISDAAIARFTLNGDTTAANYAWHELWGDGASVSPSGASGSLPYYGLTVGNNATAGIMGTTIMDIVDYASTSKNKTVRTFSGNDRNGGGIVGMWSSLYLSTSAVSSLTLYANNTSTTTTYFTSNTTIALYGIKG